MPCQQKCRQPSMQAASPRQPAAQAYTRLCDQLLQLQSHKQAAAQPLLVPRPPRQACCARAQAAPPPSGGAGSGRAVRRRCQAGKANGRPEGLQVMKRPTFGREHSCTTNGRGSLCKSCVLASSGRHCCPTQPALPAHLAARQLAQAAPLLTAQLPPGRPILLYPLLPLTHRCCERPPPSSPAPPARPPCARQARAAVPQTLPDRWLCRAAGCPGPVGCPRCTGQHPWGTQWPPHQWQRRLLQRPVAPRQALAAALSQAPSAAVLAHVAGAADAEPSIAAPLTAELVLVLAAAAATATRTSVRSSCHLQAALPAHQRQVEDNLQAAAVASEQAQAKRGLCRRGCADASDEKCCPCCTC